MDRQGDTKDLPVKKSPKGCCHGWKWKHWWTSLRAFVPSFHPQGNVKFPCIVPGKLKNHCLKSLSHKLPHLPAVATTWQKKQRQGIFAHLFIRIDGLSLDIDICLIFQFSSLQGLIHPRKANVMAPQMQTLICLHLDECFTSQESSQGFIFRKGSRIFACYTLASSHSCKVSTCTAKQYTSQTASKTKNIGIWPSHFANSKRWKCGGYRSSISS